MTTPTTPHGEQAGPAIFVSPLPAGLPASCLYSLQHMLPTVYQVILQPGPITSPVSHPTTPPHGLISITWPSCHQTLDNSCPRALALPGICLESSSPRYTHGSLSHLSCGHPWRPYIKLSPSGAPGWFSGLSLCLWLRSWSQVLGSSPTSGSLLSGEPASSFPSAAPPACPLSLSVCQINK